MTALTLGISSVAVSMNEAEASAKQTHQTLLDLESKLKDTADNAQLAGTHTAGLGSDALGAIPKVNSFAGAVGNLAQQYYNAARAAKVARIEALQTQLGQERQKYQKIYNRTPEGQDAQSGVALSALKRGNILDYLKNAFGYDRDKITQLLSNGEYGRTAQGELKDQDSIVRGIARQLRDEQDKPITAADIPGGVPGSTLSAKALQAVKKLQDQIAGLEKLADSASGPRLDRIKRQIDVRQRRLSDIQQGIDPAAATAADGLGRAGLSADTLARRAEADRKRGVRDDRLYRNEYGQAQVEILNAQADLSTDPAAKVAADRARILFQQQQTDENIASRGPGKDGTGEFTAEEVEDRQKQNAQLAALQLQNVDLQERRRNADDQRQIDDASIDIQRQLLQQQQELATTTGKRRATAQALLDLEYQQREKDLRATIAPDSKATPTEQDRPEAARRPSCAESSGAGQPRSPERRSRCHIRTRVERVRPRRLHPERRGEDASGLQQWPRRVRQKGAAPPRHFR